MRPLLFALPLAVACQDPCGKAEERILTRYEACDLTWTPPTEGGECGEEDAAIRECTADCVEATECAGLQGTDLDAANALVTCLVDCVPDTGAE